ncbi:mucin-16 [Sarcophilus harrisii]
MESKQNFVQRLSRDTGLSSRSPDAIGTGHASPASGEDPESTSLPVVASSMGTSTFRSPAGTEPVETAPGSDSAQASGFPLGSASGSPALDTTKASMSSPVTEDPKSLEISATGTVGTGSLPQAPTAGRPQAVPGSSAPLPSSSEGTVSSLSPTASPSAGTTAAREPDSTEAANSPPGSSFPPQFSSSGHTSSHTLSLAPSLPGSSSRVPEMVPTSIPMHTGTSSMTGRPESEMGPGARSSGLPFTSLSQSSSPEAGEAVGITASMTGSTGTSLSRIVPVSTAGSRIPFTFGGPIPSMGTLETSWPETNTSPLSPSVGNNGHSTGSASTRLLPLAPMATGMPVAMTGQLSLGTLSPEEGASSAASLESSPPNGGTQSSSGGESAPFLLLEPSPVGSERTGLTTASGTGLTFSPPILQTTTSISTNPGLATSLSTLMSGQPMAPDMNIPSLPSDTFTKTYSLASSQSPEAETLSQANVSPNPSPESSPLFPQHTFWTSSSSLWISPSSMSPLTIITPGSGKNAEDTTVPTVSSSSDDIKTVWPSISPYPEATPAVSFTSQGDTDASVAPVSHIPDQKASESPWTSTRDSQAPTSTVNPTGKEPDVMPITQIPDQGETEGLAALTSSPPALIDTLSTTGFSTRSTVTLKNVSGSDLEKESADFTSTPMTGSTVRDSIPDTTTEIVVMETTPGSEVAVVPVTHIPVHEALGEKEVLTRGPLEPESTVDPMDAETETFTVETMPATTTTQASLLTVATVTGDLSPETHRTTMHSPTEASTPSETSLGVTMEAGSPTVSMTLAEPTASTVSDGPLKVNPTEKISSTSLSDTLVSEKSPRESDSTTLTPWPTPVDSIHITTSAPRMEISSILPPSSIPAATSDKETTPNPDLPMKETPPEQQDVQTVTEPGSAALSSTVSSIVPTSVGGDTSIFLVSTEGPREDKTVSSTLPDTPGITQTEQIHSTSPGEPDRSFTSSQAHLSEGGSYARTVPSPFVEGMTSPAEPPTLESTEPTFPEEGTPSVAPVTEFSTMDSGKLQSSLDSTSTPVRETSRPGSTAASDTSTLSPGKFHPAESTANLMPSPVGGSSPEPAVYTTPSHTPDIATETKLRGETDLSSILTTPAPVVSITTISEALPGIRTRVPWSLTSAETTDITMIGKDTMSTLPQTFSPPSPVILSEGTYKAEDMSSNVPRTESIRVTDMTSRYPKDTTNQEFLGTVEESSTSVSLITPSLGPPVSSASIMGEIPNMSGTTTDSMQVTTTHGIPNRDSERTSGLPLATEGTDNTSTAKMTGNISMVPTEHSTETQMSSALLPTTNTSSVALSGPRTVSPSSTTAETRTLTITGTGSISSSIPITSPGVTPFTENMSSAASRTDATSLIFSTKITDIVPFSPMVTFRPELPSTVPEKSTKSPLTTISIKVPVSSDTNPVGSLITSVGSIPLETTHGVPHADLEKTSELPLTSLTRETTESTITGRAIEGITSASPEFNTGAEMSSAIPSTTSPAETTKISEAMTPRDISPSSMSPGMATVTPVHIGSDSSPAAVTQAKLPKTQSPLILTKVPQESDTEFPWSSTATEATKSVIITDSTPVSELEESQASKGTIPGTEASRNYPTLLSPSESPMTHDASPERVTSTDQAPSTLPAEELPETGTSSATFVSKMLSDVTSSEPWTSTEGFESQSMSILETTTVLAISRDPAMTFISPLSKTTTPVSVHMETGSNLPPWAASPSSKVETTSSLVDITVEESSQGRGTHSPIHESPSSSPGPSSALTTPETWTITGAPEKTSPLEDSGSAGLTTESVRSSGETPTLDVSLPPSRTQEVSIASPSPTPMATENSSSRAETASVSAQVPSTSTLFTSGDAGVVPVTHASGHGVPGSIAALTRGPLIPRSTLIPTGGEVSVAAATRIPGQGAARGTAALTSASPGTLSTSSPTSISQPSTLVTGFSARSTVAGRTTALANMTGESSEPTSTPMTGSPVRDSVSGTASEILTMETTSATEMHVNQTTPEKRDAQTGTEPGSAARPSPAPSIIPTSPGGDPSAFLVSTEGATEGQTVSGAFPENTDAPGSIHREHMHSSSPGVTLWPDRAATVSLPSLTEGSSYSRTVPSSYLGSMTSMAISGAQTNPDNSPTPGPTGPTPPEEGTLSVGGASVVSVPEFNTTDSGNLESSVASTSTPVRETSRPDSTGASDTSTLSPGKFHPAESTANLMSSPVGGSSPEPVVYTTTPHTPGTSETRPEETVSSLVMSTPAPAASLTSISGILTRASTGTPQPSTSIEATALIITGADTIPVQPKTSSPSPSATILGAEDKSSDAPGTEVMTPVPGSKVTEVVPLSSVSFLIPEFPSRVAESSSDVPLAATLPPSSISSATTVDSVQSKLSAPTDSIHLGAMTHGVPQKDLEMTPGLSLATLATEDTVSSITTKTTKYSSMTHPGLSMGAEVSSVHPASTSTGEMQASSKTLSSRETSSRGSLVTTVTHPDVGSGSGLSTVTKAELSETQSPLTITKVPQESDTGSPLSPTTSEVSGAGTITASIPNLGREDTQASMDTTLGTEASRTFLTSSPSSESPRTHITSPKRATSSDEALSTLSTEKSLGGSDASVPTKLPEVTVSAPEIGTQRSSESLSTSTLEASTAPVVQTSSGVTLIVPLSKITTSKIDTERASKSKSVSWAVSPSAQVATSSPSMADTTLGGSSLIPSTREWTYSQAPESPSQSSNLSPVFTIPTIPSSSTPSSEVSRTTSLKTVPKKISMETPTLDVSSPPARTEVVWTSTSPTQASTASEGSSARAGTASVSAPVPASSTLFTNSDDGVIPISYVPNHEAPGDSEILTVSAVSSPVTGSSEESKGKIMTTAGQSGTMIATTFSPAVGTHSVLETTTQTTAHGSVDLIKATPPASSGLPETMVASTSWPGVAISASETIITEASTPPGTTTEEGSPITVSSSTALTKPFTWSNMPPAWSTSSLDTTPSGRSREETSSTASLETLASETIALVTTRKEAALIESTAAMDISRGSETVVLSTRELPTSSIPSLITTPEMSTWTTMAIIPETVTAKRLESFTLNFTITNLFYTADMGYPGSSKFNATEKVLQQLLDSLFRNGSLGSFYSGCGLIMMRPMNDGAATGMNFVCARWQDPNNSTFDRKKLYWELSNQTHGVTRLGPYFLDKDSLYLNGYNARISVSATSIPTFSLIPSLTATPSPGTTAPGKPSLEPFTMNFTITNLLYTEDMGHPDSEKFNSMEKVLQRLLRALFKNSSLASSYSGCKLTSLRPVKDGEATGVDAVCIHRESPTNPVLDREKIYWELSKQTHGITRLGPYTLDKDSLFLNGYNNKQTPTTSIPSITTFSPVTSLAPSSFSKPTDGTLLELFTLNFTITNLFYTEDMEQKGSSKFNFTERILQRLLGLVFKKTSLGLGYSGCKLTLLGPVKNRTATRVDAICGYQRDPASPGLDREKVYWELNNQTQGITKLGPYILDKDSLYLNGYNHQTDPLSSTISPVIKTITSTPSLTLSSLPITSTATGISPLKIFTLNFTITNLFYTEDMSQRDSSKFNSTENVLQHLLNSRFKKSSLGSRYSGCSLALLRSMKNRTETGVDIVCAYMEDPFTPVLDREKVYWELSNQTHGITKLGPYTLDKDSLYLDGYNHQIPVASTSTASITILSQTMPPAQSSLSSGSTAVGSILEAFTMNFTITNLLYTEAMGKINSSKFNSTERILQHLLNPFFENSSLGSSYSGCKLTLLRSMKNQTATRADIICLYQRGPTGPFLDRERVYWELSNQTGGISRLGPYTLDKDSLYLNGYNHQFSSPATTTPILSTFTARVSSTPSLLASSSAGSLILDSFTVNFTITNLLCTTDMGQPGSNTFNATEKVLQRLLSPLFESSSIGSHYSGCRLTMLRPVKNGTATAVDVLCTHWKSPSIPSLDRKKIYWELSNQTHGITRLGPYTLDEKSLYINGYNYQMTLSSSTSTPEITTITTAPPPISTVGGFSLESFTLNFTITNLRYTADMGQRGSSKFNFTENILQHLLSSLFEKTSLGSQYSGCRLTLLRSLKEGTETGVNFVCARRTDSDSPVLDREKVYWELSNHTWNITRLGPYILDKESLYLNGYNHLSLAPTKIPIEPSLKPFTLNFTITNLRYSADMGHQNSVKFNITDTVMQHLLGPLFKNSSIGSLYSGCKVTELRSVKKGSQTGVDAVCTYRQFPSSTGLDAKQVFHELSDQTRGIRKLGPYSLDKDSLYLNGYNERGPVLPSPVLSSVAPGSTTTVVAGFPLGSTGLGGSTASLLSTSPPATSPAPSPFSSTTAASLSLQSFTLNFTITNLLYTEDMHLPGSSKFNSTERILKHLLDTLFRNSSIGPFYSGCHLTSLRPMKNGSATGVDVLCTYRRDPTRPILDREQVYREMINQTFGISRLGPYSLDKDSLYLDGYNEHSAVQYTTTLGPDTVSTTEIPLRPTELDSTTAPVTTSFASATSLAPSPFSNVTATSLSLETFTLNFTIINLPYTTEMAHPGSSKFNSTERILQRLLGPLFRGSSIGSFYSGCKVTCLRPMLSGSATGVDALCTQRRDPTSPFLDRERVYWELSNQTNNITQLGPYSLDRDSLYVNGYNGHRSVQYSSTQQPTSISAPVTTLWSAGPRTSTTSVTTVFSPDTSLAPSPFSSTTAGGHSLELFTLNFTITNLFYTEDMGHPGSGIFNSTERVLQRLLSPLFKQSSIGSSYAGCKVIALRSMKDGLATGVDAVCTHRGGPTSPYLDRERVYWELSNETHGITRLGPYTLDKNSFYLNGYNEHHPIQPTTTFGPFIASSFTTPLMSSGPGTSTVPVRTSFPPDTFATPSPFSSTSADNHTLDPFTLNFTILNLLYTEDMGRPGSVIFGSLERILQQLLNPLFVKSSIGSFYSGCRLTSLRPMKDGLATRVDIICTRWQDLARPFLDREKVYWELSNQTYGITRLGPYILDKDTLYLNGYNEYSPVQPMMTSGPATGSTFTYSLLSTEPEVYTAPVSTTFATITPSGPSPFFTTTVSSTSSLESFILNFTITNLLYTEDMGNPGSDKFNSTERVLQRRIGLLFRKSSIAPFYSGCKVISLRPMKNGSATGVDALCSRHIDPANPVLDRERIYQELSRETHGISRLGPYTLDKDSLYLDGYNEHRVAKTTSNSPVTTFIPATSLAPSPFSSSTASGHSLEAFTLNFTITNLLYSAEMEHPGSSKFNSTERILQRLLGPLFRNSSIGSSYSGCKLMSLRPMKDGLATGVDALCTYRRDPNSPALDRERVYWELSNQTYGISMLGPYSLAKDSLYLNGYNEHIPVQPSTTLGAGTASWSTTSLGPTKPGGSTAPVPSAFTPETSLVPSLISITTATGHSLEAFTLNFTITNLLYTADMGNTGSSKFNTTEKILQHLLDPLFRNTSIGSLYSGCRVISLSSRKEGSATGVDAVCLHWREPSIPFLDRERVYWELSTLTNGITRLGPYTLDKNGLYLNGYNEHDSALPATTSGLGSASTPATPLDFTGRGTNTAPVKTTYVPPTSLAPQSFPSTTAGGQRMESFTLNFIITNLLYTEDMVRPGSTKFNSTERILQRLLSPLFKRTSIGNFYTGCKLASLRSEKEGLATGVDVVCTQWRDPTKFILDREKVYWELSNQTHGFSRLGPYTLDKNSFYLNGYNGRNLPQPGTTPGLATISPPAIPLGPTGSGHWTASDPRLQPFTLNFTITNLPYTADMGHPGSTKFNNIEGALQRLLGPLFRNSSIGLYYSGCGLISLRPMMDGSATRVDAICVQQRGPTSPVFDRERVYQELSNQTHGLTKLGPYTLDKDSLCLNGYSSQSTPGQGEYQLDFRIINHNLTNSDPTSPEYQALQRDIQDKMTQLYSSSQLQDRFRYCLITGLRVGSVLVTCTCSFSSNLDPDTIGQVFLDRTRNATAHCLGDSYELDNLQVTKLELAFPLSTAKPLADLRPQHFRLNFTITSLFYSQNLTHPDSVEYQENKNGIEDALNQLFRNSSIKSYFSDCQVQTFRLVPPSSHTGVDSLCDFTSATRTHSFDRAAVYQEFLQLTNNGTRLQNFTLDRNSVLVDGYSTNIIDGTSKKTDLPYWAIILICLAMLLGLIVSLTCCFVVTMCLRKKEGDYEVQRRTISSYLSHLDLRKIH